MTQLAVISALSLVVATTSLAHAQETDPDIQRLADQENVDATDLQGALNSLADAGLPTDPQTYLANSGASASPASAVAVVGGRASPSSVGYLARVRLTYYVESGLTFSGGHTYPGSTACSWNFPIGSRFRFADGEVFTCNDRGRLGYGQPVGWLDLFRRPDLARTYGPYATVEVMP